MDFNNQGESTEWKGLAKENFITLIIYFSQQLFISW